MSQRASLPHLHGALAERAGPPCAPSKRVIGGGLLVIGDRGCSGKVWSPTDQGPTHPSSPPRRSMEYPTLRGSVLCSLLKHGLRPYLHEAGCRESPVKTRLIDFEVAFNICRSAACFVVLELNVHHGGAGAKR